MNDALTKPDSASALSGPKRSVILLTLIIPLIGLLRLRRPRRAALYTALAAVALIVAHAARASGAWPGPAWAFPPLAIIHIAAAYDAFRVVTCEPELPARAGYSSWSGVTALAVLLATIAHVTIDQFATPFNIASASMAPALIQGDRVLVRKLTEEAQSRLERGDIVMFQLAGRPEEIFVKRILALPGDHIRVQGQAVFLNGNKLEHDTVEHNKLSADSPRWLDVPRLVEHLGEIRHDILIADPAEGINGEWRIPPRHYFLMGDNRNLSNDSRFFGPIAADNIIGKPYVIWWSAVTSGMKQTRWERVAALVR